MITKWFNLYLRSYYYWGWFKKVGHMALNIVPNFWMSFWGDQVLHRCRVKVFEKQPVFNFYDINPWFCSMTIMNALKINNNKKCKIKICPGFAIVTWVEENEADCGENIKQFYQKSCQIFIVKSFIKWMGNMNLK